MYANIPTVHVFYVCIIYYLKKYIQIIEMSSKSKNMYCLINVLNIQSYQFFVNPYGSEW